jgi:hypothetical protein
MGSVNTILQSGNIHEIQKAEYDANVMLQKSRNELEAAKAGLAEFSRSLANIHVMEAAGKEYNEAVTQFAATLEARQTGRINDSLAAAERTGALMAQASALGVGGASVDLLNKTIELQRNIQQDMNDQATERMASSAARSSAQIMDNATNAMDLTRTFGNFDYTIHIAPNKMKRKWGKVIGVAAATYFGGPQAGEAAADAMVGSWQASNANYGGAAQNFDSAIGGAMSSWKEWNDRGGQSWFGAVSQKRNQESAEGTTKINWGAFGGEDGGFGYDFGAGWFN